MSNTIINVARQFGSGGGDVAKAVGRRLGIKVYDNAMISETAQERGYSKEIFRHSGEKKSIFSMSSFFASGRYGTMTDGYAFDTTLFNLQSEVIRQIAESGDAIIIGRCADYILRDMDCLNVFVSAPLDFRIHRISDREQMSEKEAETLILKKDRIRETYYNFFTLGSWGKADNYDLCIDSSILGIEGSAEFLIDFAKKAGIVR